MPIASFQETVTGTAQKLVNFSKFRSALNLSNLGATDIFLGSNNQLSILNGFPIKPGQAVSFARIFGSDPTTPMFFIVAIGSSTLAILEEYEKEVSAKLVAAVT